MEKINRQKQTPRQDLYQEITNKIIAQMKQGKFPWVQPWSSSHAACTVGLPVNATTQRRYSGINVLILWGAVFDHGFTSQNWLTFKQAKALGGSVRKGEKGQVVPIFAMVGIKPFTTRCAILCNCHRNRHSPNR